MKQKESRDLIQVTTRQMALKAALICLALTGCSQSPATPENTLKKQDEWQLLQGTWQAVVFEESGHGRSPSNITEQIFFVFDKDQYVWVTPFGITSELHEEMAGSYSVCSTSTPEQIDFQDRFLGVSLGIYEFTNDCLRICFNPSENGRPTAFETSTIDIDHFMLVLKRTATRPEWRKR